MTAEIIRDATVSMGCPMKPEAIPEPVRPPNRTPSETVYAYASPGPVLSLLGQSDRLWSDCWPRGTVSVVHGTRLPRFPAKLKGHMPKEWSIRADRRECAKVAGLVPSTSRYSPIIQLMSFLHGCRQNGTDRRHAKGAAGWGDSSMRASWRAALAITATCACVGLA